MSAAVIEDALTDELRKLGPEPDTTPAADETPAKPNRRSRSGTSGAERNRRAKAAGAHSGADTPPRRSSTATRKKPAIAAGMANLYSMVGVGLSVVPSKASPVMAGQTITQVVGQALVSESANIGAAWEKAAAEDPRIREALEKLLTVSTLGAVIAAHVPVIVAGMLAAGAMPAGMAAVFAGQPTTEAGRP